MIREYKILEELALDLRWSWNHSADILWNELDPDLWELTHNPWIVLQTISKARLEKAISNPKFQQIADSLIKAKKAHEQSSSWFQENHSKTLSCIAYFSMEFMLSEALPIYSGGLGNVAGDQLKAASDLGVPVIGIGLLYAQGYFRQIIDKHGNQQAIFPYNDPGQLPISPLRTQDGEWLRIKIGFPGGFVWIRTWEVQVGRAKLYLLDTNDPANFPVDRGITNELYGGDEELRLKQEIVLGIGGWKLLSTLGINPEVCHLNEGHAAFAILERVQCYMEQTGVSFNVAWTAIRSGTIFTTHTAVPAGFDRFSHSLMKDYLGHYAVNQLKISFHELMALGKELPDTGFFNMAYLAIRGSGAVNGVSRLHAEVSRKLFEPLFPRWPNKEIPISHVTNGVHMPSWDSPEADALWTKYCGKSRWLETTENLEEKVKKIPDIDIWEMAQNARSTLIQFARHRLFLQSERRGADPEELDKIRTFLDPEALTLGFARRFASYKRPNLLLHDPQRLLKILMNPKYPVQLILAGKAHPADRDGQMLIKKWMHFIFKNPEARSRVVFLSDYDVLLTEHLVQGTDVWINTPRRPWEACGTSGMKVLVNGGLNLSSRDGWWAESYSPEVGWAIGDDVDQHENPEIDALDAKALYDLLEHQVIPEFYDRDPNGIPISWIEKIRYSMAKLTPFFSANRAVRQYTEEYYLPAAKQFRKRTEKKASLAKQIAEWEKIIKEHWEKVHFNGCKWENQTAIVEVSLDGLDPECVQVELFAEGSPPFKQQMQVFQKVDNRYFYKGCIPKDHLTTHYTPRITPFHPEVMRPLEMLEIKWQK